MPEMQIVLQSCSVSLLIQGQIGGRKRKREAPGGGLMVSKAAGWAALTCFPPQVHAHRA